MNRNAIRWIAFSTGLCLLLFQNCAPFSGKSWQNSNPQGEPNFGSKPIVSAPMTLALRQRTPLGQRYSDGSLAVQAGAQLFSWNSEGLRSVSPAANQYTQGSTHLTTSLDDGSMLAIDMRTNTSGQYIQFDGATNKWVGRYLRYDSPFGTLMNDGVFTIDVLPGSSTEHYEPFSIFRTPNYTYMSLYRLRSRTEPWVINGTSTEVQALVGDSWLVRSSNDNPYEFTFVGAIAEREDYLRVLNESGLPQFKLPLFYAAGPRCLGINDNDIVCVMRGSADDDDGNRPLNPDDVFEPSLSSAPLTENYFFGSRVARGIYSPPLSMDRFYVPKNELPIPPLLVAASKDGGRTWKHKFIAARGGVDAHLAFDPMSRQLLLAYGGLSYPRRGIAIQWTSDVGDSWSEPLIVSEPLDAFTTGTVFVANTSPGRFVLVYDSMARYHEFNYVEGQPRPTPVSDGYRILYRTLDF